MVLNTQLKIQIFLIKLKKINLKLKNIKVLINKDYTNFLDKIKKSS